MQEDHEAYKLLAEGEAALKAGQELLEASDVVEQQAAAYKALGSARWRRGDSEDALKDFDAAIGLVSDPYDRYMRAQVLVALERLPAVAFADALSFVRSQKVYSGRLGHAVSVGWALRRSAPKFDDLMDLFERMTILKPERGDWWIYFAVVQVEGKMVERAQRSLAKARELFATPLDVKREAELFPPDERRSEARALLGSGKVVVASCEGEDTKKAAAKEGNATAYSPV